MDFLEIQRWGENSKNRYCPHCGSLRTYKFKEVTVYSRKKIEKGKIPEHKYRRVYKCGDCRKQFTPTVGTIFEGSHIPLSKWFWAIYLNASMKKGISSLQLSKMLDITQKASWFMLQRIRYGLENSVDNGKLANVVEIDESFIGGSESNKHADKRIKGSQGRGSCLCSWNVRKTRTA